MALGFGLPSIVAPITFAAIFSVCGVHTFMLAFAGIAVMAPIFTFVIPESHPGDESASVWVNPVRSFRILCGPSRDLNGGQSFAGTMRTLLVVTLFATLP